MFILDDLLLWLPLKGLVAVSKRLEDLVEKERTMESDVSSELVENQISFELGEIDEKEFNRREERLLEEMNKRKKDEEESE